MLSATADGRRHLESSFDVEDRPKGCERKPDSFPGVRAAARAIVTGALEARFRDLYRAAGVKTSSHSGRRSFASALMRKGVTIEQMAIFLGHVNEDVTAAYIAIDRLRLIQMYETAI